MILRIARTEWRLLWRDRRLLWLTGIAALILAAAAVTGWRERTIRHAAIVEAQASQRQQWLDKQVGNAHVAAHTGTVVFRELPPLAALDSGVDPFLGISVYLEPHRRNLFAERPDEGRLPVGRIGGLTAVVALQLVVPLLILLLTFNSIATEREAGTLRQLLSVGVSPWRLVAGKMLGIGVPIAAAIAPGLALVWLALRGAPSMDHARTALWIGGYVIYVLVIVLVGVLISLRAATAQRALIVLLAFWVVSSFAVPRLAAIGAGRWHPPPTATEFRAALDHAGDADDFFRHRARVEARLLREYGVSRAVDLPVSTWGMTLFEREAESTERYNEVFDRLFATYAEQQQVLDAASLVSPALAMRLVSMALAGTDVAHFRHFAEAAERYRFALVQAMNEVAVQSRLYNSSPNLAALPDQVAFPEGERAAYERVPPFAYRPPPAMRAVRQVSVPLLSLALWSLGLAAALAYSLRRVAVD